MGPATHHRGICRHTCIPTLSCPRCTARNVLISPRTPTQFHAPPPSGAPQPRAPLFPQRSPAGFFCLCRTTRETWFFSNPVQPALSCPRPRPQKTPVCKHPPADCVYQVFVISNHIPHCKLFSLCFTSGYHLSSKGRISQKIRTTHSFPSPRLTLTMVRRGGTALAGRSAIQGFA